MIIQLNTDSHIKGDESLASHVETVVEGVLGRFSGQITRVEVHLSDVNAGKAGSNDKHCTMEARVDGRPPAAATEDAETVRDAINGAAHKLKRVLDSSLGKLGK
ncbi:MAG: HPF/RaiA family ribosome-associated protein [Proteobacteria bacterium]|nr:HPF/RaiA family ribosome-associated protein [Pseudomonadota bacterium]